MLVNGPAIPIDGDDVRVLSTPAEFYEQLIQNIAQAKDRLVITSLYIGNGELEEKLYREIESFLERGGSATIIVDHGRGLRGEKKSTYARCLKMYKQYHHNLTLGVLLLSFSCI
jgi:CDP-diacylglycerol--glycerol-3-phosphate 3-phosphatidyltransferase